ncbi:MAG: hypothetical protein HQL11_02085, partial [Candidatus Omnitrophica bacterium]|nr:hypothetical protein [Candidatus Omnitrophota bacterium]
MALEAPRLNRVRGIAIALMLRLAALPLFLHGDLFFIHHFPFYWTNQGVWDVYGHFGHFFLNRHRVAGIEPTLMANLANER